jgi:molybdate transport system substrate-binding protein
MSATSSHRPRSLIVSFLAIALLAVACGGGGSKDGGDLPEFTTTTFPKDTVSGDLKVFAASSLTEVFTALGQAFEKKNPDAKVVSNFTFAESAALAQQVNDGAPVDVFVSGDDANMVKVISAGNVANALPIARSVLTLLVQKGNPKGITGLADLAKPGVTFAMCSPDVLYGTLAATALTKAGVTATPKAQESDVKAVVSHVTGGDVDAAIVTLAEVKVAGDKADAVPIDIAADPDLQAKYQIGVTKQVQHREAADAWIRYVRSDDALQILANFGFGAP